MLVILHGGTMRIWLFVAVALVLVLATALLMGADVAKGKEVYMSKCTACHAPGGEGKEAIAKMFKVEMKPLGGKEIQAMKDDQIEGVILKGNGKMKPVDIPKAQATDVVAFLRTLAKK